MHASITQTVRSIIHARTGVMVGSDDERLAAVIPNSMAFMGVLTACEDELGVLVDFSRLSRGTTIRQFAELLQSGRQQEQAGPEQEEDAGGPLNVAMNPMQVAYLLGGSEGIELGGQATFVYFEAVFPFEPARVLAAVEEVMARHDVFRARLNPDEATVLIDPQQGLSPVPVISLDECDDPGASVEQVRCGLLAQARRSNDGELYGATIVEQRGTARLCIYLNMIIMDAASMFVFLREVAARLAGEPMLPVVSYAQAAAHIEARRNDQVREQAREYWADIAPTLPPAPRFAPGVAVYDAWSTRRCFEHLPKDVFAGLRQRAKDDGVSLSSVLLAIHAAAIARWANQPAFSVNVTVTERTDLDPNAAIMGDFTSSLLVGIDTTTAPDITGLAEEIHAKTVDGLMHRGLSGVEVLQTFLRRASSQQEAVMPVVFTSYIDGARSQGAGGQLAVDYTYTQTCQVFLDMQMMPHGDSMSISWDYVPEYFGFDVGQMFDTVISAVKDYARGGDPLPIRAAGVGKAVARYNRTGQELPTGTLMSAVLDSFTRFADRPAIVSPALGCSYTYAQVDAISARVARYLVDQGCRPGDVVMIESTKHPMSIINQLAVLRAGAAFIPVNAAYPAERKRYIATTAGALDMVLDDASHDEALRANYPAHIRPVHTDPEELAYIIFTSGSTGRPKGVEISHAGAVNTINDINARFRVNPDDVVIGLSALSFDLSIYDIYGALGAGACLAVVTDERDADEIHQVMDECGVTIWNSTPALVELALLRAEATSYPGLRLLMMSGDRIAPDLPARARRLFPTADIYSLGGATEGSIWSIYFPLDDSTTLVTAPYGYPLANQQMYVLGFDNRPCPVGVPGEICIGGRGVALGYRGEPDKTAAAFVHTPYGRLYRTGDVGVFNAHGYIDFLGRRDRQVKIRGHRIELGEIEAVLARAPRVSLVQAAVLKHLGRDALVAFVVPDGGGADVDQEGLVAIAHDYLPDYMVPQYIVALDEVPVTDHGKVNLPGLQKLFDVHLGGGVDEPTDRLDPRHESMRLLWEDILQAPVTSDDASFFELGGDSLRFQALLRRIRQETGRVVRFRDIIIEPTVRHVCELVNQTQAQLPERRDGQDAVEIGGEFDPFPLTDMQMAYLVGRSEAFALGGVSEHYYIEAENELDIQRFEDAFNALISRHAMLHAVINDDGTQRILSEVPRYHIEVVDLSGATPGELERAITWRRGQLSHERFTPGRWPQFSLSAFDLGDSRYRLFFSVDMILADGASQRIILDDLTRLYHGEELPAVRGRFRDYVMAMQAGRGSSFGSLEREEIDQIVDGFPVGNVLPQLSGASMGERPSVQRLSRCLGAEESAALRAVARQHGVSISSLCAAAYVNSLCLWSTRSRVGVNVTTYNRDPRVGDAQNVVGDFTGVVLLSYPVAGSGSIFDLAVQVQGDLLEHLDAEYSGVRMVSEISRRKNAIGQAVAPFVLTSLLFDTEQPDMPVRDASIFGSIQYALSQTPQVLLDNQLVPLGQEIWISWDYVASFFDEQLMGELFDHYLGTLRSCASGDGSIPPVPAYSAGLIKNMLFDRVDEHIVAPSGAGKPSRSRCDESEGQVLAIARRRMSLPMLGTDDNLFDAGVDSLGFIALVKEIENEYQIRIPLASALGDPSVANLAALVVQDTRPRIGDAGEPTDRASLVWLAPGGAVKVVLVHGGFGTVEIYRDLAVALPKEWDVWGLQFNALVEPFPRRLRVEEVAERYARELREQFAPGSHLVLVGWSIGGTLCAELSRLVKDDYQVDLAFLDSLAPGPQVDVGDFGLETEREMLCSVLPEAQAAMLRQASSTPEVWTMVAGLVKNRSDESALVRRLAGSISTTLMEDLGVGSGVVTIDQFNTLRTLIAARNDYRPHHTMTRLMVLHATEGEAHNYADWVSLAPDGFCTGELAGDHYSILLGAGAGTTAETIVNHVALSDMTHAEEDEQ